MNSVLNKRSVVTEHPVTHAACSPEERERVLACLDARQPWELPKEAPKEELRGAEQPEPEPEAEAEPAEQPEPEAKKRGKKASA